MIISTIELTKLSLYNGYIGYQLNEIAVRKKDYTILPILKE